MSIPGGASSAGATNPPIPSVGSSASGNNGSGDLRASLGTVLHNAACSCLGRGTGLMLRESDCELMAEAVLAAGYRRVVEDDTTVRRVAEALAAVDGWEVRWPARDADLELAALRYLTAARAAVRALREDT